MTLAQPTAGPSSSSSSSAPLAVPSKAGATSATTVTVDDVDVHHTKYDDDGEDNVGIKTMRESEDHSNPTIHTLAQAGDVPGLERLLAESGGTLDLNAPDESNVTALHWAAINAHVSTCQWLLEHGAEVDPIGGDLQATPLQWAARSGHLYILHLLLRYNADPLILDTQGFNTLHLVTHSSVVMALLYMLHQPVAVDEKDGDGHTALMWAAWQGDAISIDLLLRHGASVSTTDSTLLTPLHWAAVKGSRACIKRLVEAGADLYAKEEGGKTPRDMAVELKALEPWVAGLRDAGMDEDGRKKGRVLGERATKYTVMFGPTVFLFLIFCAMKLPAYSGIPLGIGLFFGMHHLLTRVVLGSKGIGDEVARSPYFAAIIGGSLFWVGYCWMTRLILGTPGHLTLNSIFGVCFIACCVSFYRAIVLDPGWTKKIEDDEELKEVIEDLTSSGRLNGTVFCISCMAKKPLRAKHCRMCNRCTARFDHHCPWIWNCVGYNNHREFLVFVGTLVVGIFAFIALTVHYFSENTPEDLYPSPSDSTISSAYPTVCNVSPSLCAASHYDAFLLSTAAWSALQLTWTILLLVSQIWQVCRQMTTLEVSNVGRYGWMGGMGGTSLREQGGALAKVMSGKGGVPGTSIFAQPGSGGRSAVGSLTALGAGPGPEGVDEEGGMLLDDDENAPAMGVRSPIGNGGHLHGHGGHGHGAHSHRFGLVGKICSTASVAMGGPMGQLLGFDRFTKGKAVKGLTSSGGNPFDLGIVGNCQDFWTKGGTLNVDYRTLYDIPSEGFRARRRNRQMSRTTTMPSGIGLGVKGLTSVLPMHRERGGDGYELVQGRESDV